MKRLALLAVALLAGCAPARPSAEAGGNLYQANGCVSCHGHFGHGDGPLATTLPSRPLDFRYAAGFRRGDDEDTIAKTLAEGVPADHSKPELHRTHHELLMPKFAHLSELERRSIALYVISFRSKAD